ncbi:MAG TPA: hypothetical protein VLD37_02920 [Candidatus Bilamarchaeum sp.]|nr:hypothetical protein [Candidatus Bilamarchaeum sp.]
MPLCIVNSAGVLIRKEWVRKAPELGEIVSKVVDGRGGRRGRAAIVIPTFRADALMDEHLRRLSLQKSRSFDVIIVYSPGDGQVRETHGIRAVHIWRNWDGGSAGGFYVGEKYAVGEGYEFVILADNDCLPVSETLVESLVGAASGGLSMPYIISGQMPASPNGIIAHYGCIGAGVLKEAGLTFLPFHMGGEDFELLGRIEGTGRKAQYTRDTAAHPASSLIACPPSKAFGYLRGGGIKRILLDPYQSAFAYFLASLMGALAMFFLNPAISLAMLAGLFSAAGMDFSAWKGESGAPQAGKPAGILYGQAGALEYFFRLPGYFGREVVFEDRAGLQGIPVLFLARRAWLKSQGKGYLISDNRTYFLFPLRVLVVLAAFPLAALAALLLCSAGYLNKMRLGIRTYGYGK